MERKRAESGVEDRQTAQEAKPNLNSREGEARGDERKASAYQENIIKEQNVKAEGIVTNHCFGYVGDEKWNNKETNMTGMGTCACTHSRNKEKSDRKLGWGWV